jgi:hypothetical protein
VVACPRNHAPVVKAAGAFFFVTIPIACLEASLYDRRWREADVRHNGQVGYLAAPALPFLETSTLTGTP